MKLITPKTKTVQCMTKALRSLRVGDGIVWAKKPKRFSFITWQAQTLGIAVTQSAKRGEPAIIARIA